MSGRLITLFFVVERKKTKQNKLDFAWSFRSGLFLIYIATFCRCLCLLTGLCLPGAYCPGLNSCLSFRDRTRHFDWGILLPRTKKNLGLCPYRSKDTDLDFPRSLCPYRPQRGRGLGLAPLHFESVLSVALFATMRALSGTAVR